MITIWHNPRCSKSRATLALVEDNGDVTVRRYLEDAPTKQELHEVLALLGLSAAAIIRKGEAEFQQLNLSLADSDDTLIEAMVRAPKLIERPIVIANGKARIGRPPEAVLDIL